MYWTILAVKDQSSNGKGNEAQEERVLKTIE